MQPYQQPSYYPHPDTGMPFPTEPMPGPPPGPMGAGSPSMLDPSLLKSARHIYRTYYEVHPEVVQRPIGVAIGRSTRRGKLIFGEKPVLLPHECFIPLSQIEPGLH